MRRPHPRPVLLAVALLVVAVGAGPAPVLAARLVLGAGVPPGQTHQGTLTVRDQTAAIQGTVDGDLSVQASAHVTVTGHVTGQLRANGGSVVSIGPGGRVDGGISASTGTFVAQNGSMIGRQLATWDLSSPAVIDGRVGGDARISGSGVTVGPAADVSGALWVWAPGAQPVAIDGTVAGALHVSGATPQIGPHAHVQRGGDRPSIASAPLIWPVGIALAVAALLLVTLEVYRRRRRSARPAAP